MPDFAVYQGRHDFDGQLPDWTPTGIASRVSFFKSAIAAAQAFDPATLSEAQRFERDYLIAVAARLSVLAGNCRSAAHQPVLLCRRAHPSVYVTRPYAPAETRLKAYIVYLKNVPKRARQVRVNLRTPLHAQLHRLRQGRVRRLLRIFHGRRQAAFVEVKDPALQRQLDAASAPAAKAMKGLADWLEAQRPRGDAGFPARRRPVPRRCCRYRDGRPAARPAGGDRPGRSQAQPGCAARGLRPLSPPADRSKPAWRRCRRTSRRAGRCRAPATSSPG